MPKIIPELFVKTLLLELYKKKENTKKETFLFYTIVRDILSIELLFISGVRVTELSNIEITDISNDLSTLRIFGKGRKERIIPLYSDSLTDLLKEYLPYRSSQNNFLLQNRVKKQFSSQSIRFMIKKYVAEFNIPLHITPHMFRHTVATMLLENELDIRYIQHFLGHSSISTTEIYTHVTAQRYKEHFNTKHPRRLLLNEG